MNRSKSAICAVIVACACATALRTEVQAEDRIEDCKQSATAVTVSDTLVYSSATDESQGYCRFFVSRPPPAAVRPAVEEWFKAAERLSADRSVVTTVANIAVAPIPKEDWNARKVGASIIRNKDIVISCVDHLFKKLFFEARSDDGVLSCRVLEPANALRLDILFKNSFHSVTSLPSKP